MKAVETANQRPILIIGAQAVGVTHFVELVKNALNFFIDPGAILMHPL